MPRRHAFGRDFGQKIGGGGTSGELGAVPGGRAIGERRGGGRVWSKQVAQLRQPGELAGGVGLVCQLINLKRVSLGVLQDSQEVDGKRWPGMPVVREENRSLEKLGGKIGLGFLVLASLLP